jgi:YbbR domain-containing protein
MSRLWNRLKHNLWLKIAALFFAILLWSFVISETDPERNRSYGNIPIEVVGVAQLDRNNLAIKGEVGAIFTDASVSLSLKVSELGSLESSSVGVIADVSAITEPGKYAIPLTGHSPVGSVIKVIPASITVEVEEKVTAQFPIQVLKSGDLADGLYSADPVVTPQYLEISGAASDVAAIRNAVIRLDETNLTSSYTGRLPVELLGEGGEVISYKRFMSDQPAAEVSMEILPTKKLLIDTSSVLEDAGAVAQGYRVAGISVSPSEVEVAAPAQILANLTKLSVEKVRIRGANQSMELTTQIILPEGVRSTGTKEITIKVEIVAAE